jgi:hypothetical protein
MKTANPDPRSPVACPKKWAHRISARYQPAKTAAFTMAEMMIALGIFSLLILGMVAAQIYGMRVYTISATKLVATSGARQVLSDIRDQIREANLVYLGNVSSDWTTYTDITNGNQQGNAIEIYPTTNSTPYLICYLDTTTSTNNLMLYSSVGTTQLLTSYITNTVVFDAEDLYGNILTNNQNNRVIHMTLQFSQWEYPIAHIGGTNYNSYDYYQLRTRATRRAID